MTLILSDFDDTIVETRESRGGAFRTKFKLFRINHRATSLQREPEGDEVVEVSPIDLHRIRPYLGKGNLEPGNFPREQKLENGKVIRPGEYMLRVPDSFEYFLAAPPGKNYLLADFKEAEASDAGGNWKGPFWENMVEILDRPETAATFGIITARGHSREEWGEFFKYLKKQGYIKYLPNLDLIHSISRPEYDQFGIDHQIHQRKQQLLDEVVASLAAVRLTEADDRLDPNAKGNERLHYLVFADNDSATIEAVTRSFQNAARSMRVPVKLGVFNYGTKSEVIATQRPPLAIVQSDGTFRHATQAEQFGEPKHLTKEADSCGEGVANQ